MSGTKGDICFWYRRWIKKSRKVGEPPEEVKKLFKKYSDNERMTRDHLRQFLQECQGETQDDAQQYAEKAFIKYKNPKKGLTFGHFFQYLLGNLIQPFDLQKSESYMTSPLAHYFWHTGYDSYLYFKWRESIETKHDPALSDHEDEDIGSQSHFGGRTIIHSIKKALTDGVKVIELDLKTRSIGLDNVDVQYQGTSPVSFKKCLGVIKENAFAKSPYPVIIILVNYYNLEDKVQDEVKKRIKKTFGDSWSHDREFDSPHHLKEKIITLTINPEISHNKTESPNKDVQDEQVAYKQLIPLRELKDGQSEHQNIDPNKENLVSFTQNNLLGVYLNPKGTGISSSDYNPFIGWAKGVQMVACNMKADSNKNLERHLEKYIEKYVWLMQGMFRAYGNFGYVKKPDILLTPSPNFDPTAWRTVKKILKVTVYMGSGWHLHFDSGDFDATSPPDFFAAIEIVGVPRDEAREKTLPAMDQWIPKWNQEFKFPLTVPELAFLVIKVSEFDTDRTHDFGGQTCLPVSALKSGIRSVPLFDMRGAPYRAVKLLVRFQFDPLPTRPRS